MPHASESYPFRGNNLDLAGIRLHYLDEGQGEPVVMLHGNPTWSFYYRNLVHALRPCYRVIVPDHVGCGLSDKPNQASYPYTLARRVADLEALLDCLELRDNLTLVVHDWGGMIGLAFAHRHPERVRRLVILNTAGFHLPLGKRLPWSLRLCRNRALGPLLVRGLNGFCRGAARFCSMAPLPPSVRAAYLGPYDSWNNRIAVFRFVQDIPLAPSDPGYDLVSAVQEGLSRFRGVPTLICWGERDFVFDADFLAEWRRRLPEAEVHTFPDAGHYLLEDAGDQVALLVQDFLTRHPLKTVRDTPPISNGAVAAPAHSQPGVAEQNIAAHVPDRARERPQTLAVIEPLGRDHLGQPRYRHFTFQELNADSDRLARGLERIGIGPGVRTILMVTPGLDFYSLTFALFKVGAVVVLIDPGMGIKNLKRCLDEVGPQAFIGTTRAHLARVLFGWGRATVKICVTVGRRLGWTGVTVAQLRRLGGNLPYPLVQPGPEDIAAILFTSGSTGVAKGVVYSHANFNAQLELLRTAYNIQPGEVDLPTFPLFGLFGPALGMTVVVPRMDPTRPAQVDPRTIIDTIRDFGVTNLFGSPALVRRVGAYGASAGVHLPTLRRVISAGAPVPAKAIAQFQGLLDSGVEIHTPYGATEALPVSSIGSSQILEETQQRTAQGAGVCVGVPLPGVHVRVIRIADDAIPSFNDEWLLPIGQTGEIVVKGPVVTKAYYNRPDATALAKIVDPAGGTWHRMGDVGYLDERGRLWFCGRKSQRVITSDETLFTIPCEGIFNAHPSVWRTALVGVQRNGTTLPVLCVERDPASSLPEETLRQELLALAARHPMTRLIATILFHPQFPVDIRHNAKIFREKLAAWAATRLPQDDRSMPLSQEASRPRFQEQP